MSNKFKISIAYIAVEIFGIKFIGKWIGSIGK